MEKIMPSLEYERIVLSPELETSDEEDDKRFMVWTIKYK
jgi:hypothetical protein